MIQYIVEVILWTLIFFIIFELFRILIISFVIKPNEIRRIYNKTKSENERI